MLVEAAGSVGRMKSKNYLAAQHARLTRRRGMGRAQVAVAHSILVAVYYMLQRDQPYKISAPDWHHNATRKLTPDGWSPSWRSSATPWSSTQQPENRRPARGSAARGDADVLDDYPVVAGDADWLLEQGVTVAAMESTSTYWKPPFYCLEEVMEVWLLNAAHMKAVPGRKTDVRDAEWIAQLLEHGLLRPSFVPPPDIRRLRMLTRYRVQLMGDRTRETIRLELMLEDASIKLSAVASSLTTRVGAGDAGAMIDGERDPRVLADMAQGPDAAQDPGPGRGADRALRRPPRPAGPVDPAPAGPGRAALAELDAVIAAACLPWAHQIELLQTIPGVGDEGRAGDHRRDRWGHVPVPVRGAPGGVGRVAPAIHESAGKRTPAGSRQGNKWLTAMLVEAAGSVGRMHGKNYLAAQHARLTRRRGMGRAQVAVAHSILVSAYYMLKRDEPYQDLGPDWLARRNAEAHTRRLVAQLERLGHTVSPRPRRLNPAPPSASGSARRLLTRALRTGYSRVCVCSESLMERRGYVRRMTRGGVGARPASRSVWLWPARGDGEAAERRFGDEIGHGRAAHVTRGWQKRPSALRCASVGTGRRVGPGGLRDGTGTPHRPGGEPGVRARTRAAG